MQNELLIKKGANCSKQFYILKICSECIKCNFIYLEKNILLILIFYSFVCETPRRASNELIFVQRSFTKGRT